MSVYVVFVPLYRFTKLIAPEAPSKHCYSQYIHTKGTFPHVISKTIVLKGINFSYRLLRCHHDFGFTTRYMHLSSIRQVLTTEERDPVTIHTNNFYSEMNSDTIHCTVHCKCLNVLRQIIFYTERLFLLILYYCWQKKMDIPSYESKQPSCLSVHVYFQPK